MNRVAGFNPLRQGQVHRLQPATIAHKERLIFLDVHTLPAQNVSIFQRELDFQHFRLDI